MNKNKICSNLLNQVKTLNTKNFKDVFVFSNNFNDAKLFLDTYKYPYKPYRFINCFYLPVDEDDLNILNQIKYDLEAWGIVQYGIDCKNLGEGRLRIKYGDNDFMGLDKFEIKTIVKSLGGKYENS